MIRLSRLYSGIRHAFGIFICHRSIAFGGPHAAPAGGGTACPRRRTAESSVHRLFGGCAVADAHPRRQRLDVRTGTAGCRPAPVFVAAFPPLSGIQGPTALVGGIGGKAPDESRHNCNRKAAVFTAQPPLGKDAGRTQPRRPDAPAAGCHAGACFRCAGRPEAYHRKKRNEIIMLQRNQRLP